MTDDLDTLRDALRNTRPRTDAKRRGMDAAMAAFDAEFSDAAGKPEKNTASDQGTDTERRLTGQNARTGRAKTRRRSMTRLSKLTLAVGGSSIAAVLALFIVVNTDDRHELGFADWGMSATKDIPLRQQEQPEASQTGFQQTDVAELSASDDAGDVIAATPRTAMKPKAIIEPSAGLAAQRSVVAAQKNFGAVPRSNKSNRAIVGNLNGTSNTTAHVTSNAKHGGQTQAPLTNSLDRVAVPGKSAIITTPVPFNPELNTISHAEAKRRDRFADFTPNPVISSAESPVSTFSIDVDTASYSFLRSTLNRGQLPRAREVRVEELINYFPYDYAAPESADEPFRANVTVTPTPWNADTKLLHIGIKGYVPPAATRPKANIVFLIDTSGSMNQVNKLPLLISSFKLMLDTLDENDTVSIVSYAGSAGTVLEPTAASNRAKIVEAFDRLNAGGSTAGAAGLRLAYAKAQESFDAEGVNRVILATDGDFNVGFSSNSEMQAFVEKKRETGVFLSVLGFGRGNYNDALMQTLAQNGNGIAAYIDTLSEARKVLADEAGSALIPIANDVKIQVEFNPQQISEYRLIGYETRALKRQDFNNDAVDAGDINSGHTVTAIYEMTPKGSGAEVIDPLRYGQPEAVTVSASDEYAFVKIRHKKPGADSSTLQTRPVTSADETVSLGNASDDTRFAIAVAALGQKLRGQSQLAQYSYKDAIDLANGAKGEDAYGYRAEFVGLARLVGSLDTDH